MDDIIRSLHSVQFHCNSEEELQDGIAELFPSAEREVRLSGTDRIDFLIGGIGIEVKMAGSLAGVTRQLHRYAQSERVNALILVTTKHRHDMLPSYINGKRLEVCVIEIGM